MQLNPIIYYLDKAIMHMDGKEAGQGQVEDPRTHTRNPNPPQTLFQGEICPEPIESPKT